MARAAWVTLMLLLIFPNSIFAGPLLDFIKGTGEEVISAVTCDNMKTEAVKSRLKVSPENVYTVDTMESTRIGVFIMFAVRKDNKGSISYFADGNYFPKALRPSREKWDRMLKRVSPNYFNYFYGRGEHDCQPQKLGIDI